MGLYVSHDAWQGAYSAFSRWRDMLTETAGYGLGWQHEDGTFVRGEERPLGTEVAEHGTPWRAADIDWSRFEDKNYLGEWDLPPEDPLLLLIVHSDCGGLIPAKLVPFLRERLERLMPDIPEGEGGGHIGNWREKTQTFIDGLRRAEEKGEDVEFS